jgi:hypothetical protein
MAMAKSETAISMKKTPVAMQIRLLVKDTLILKSASLKALLL